jgi:hypothetical protein
LKPSFAQGVTEAFHGIANFASRFAQRLLDIPFSAVGGAVVFHASIAHRVPKIFFYRSFYLIDLAFNLRSVWYSHRLSLLFLMTGPLAAVVLINTKSTASGAPFFAAWTHPVARFS